MLGVSSMISVKKYMYINLMPTNELLLYIEVIEA